MGLQEIRTYNEFELALSSKPQSVAYFWASWCEPCKHMDAVVQQLAKAHENVAFLRVEAEEIDEVTERCAIATVPFFVFFKGQTEEGRLEGADAAALTQHVQQLAAGASSTSGPSPPAPPPSAPAPPAAAAPGPSDVVARIKSILAAHPLVLFMKGDAEQPYCGFSGRTVAAVRGAGSWPLHTVDILKDEELRQTLKEFSQWPTYPQLFLQGELVGGCDIVCEMAASGELRQLLVDKLGAAPSAAAVAAAPAPTAAPAATRAPVAAAAPPAAAVAPPAANGEALHARLQALLQREPVMLFMKGTPDAPRCGFSRKVVEALRTAGIPHGAFDILTDEGVRQGLKELSNWPTYPQLYVRGELVGGCDIVLEMAANGELKPNVDEMMHRMQDA